MNPYAKIAIKVGVVVLICLILVMSYKILVKPRFKRQAKRLQEQLDRANEVKGHLESLLRYDDILPQIRQVQYQDMQLIKNLVPDASDFMLTSYLRLIHRMLQEDHLETDGISISHSGATILYHDFNETFTDDIAQMQEDLQDVLDALDYFETHMNEMDNMLVSFEFYDRLATDEENFAAIAAGIQAHGFGLNVRGSYHDIKKFTFDIFNMRPHTALTNFQLRPAGEGMGPTRQYVASFRLITYGDNNIPPPLWVAKEEGLGAVLTSMPAPAEETEETEGE